MTAACETWRLKQDGLVVATVEGPADRARANITHYARVYGQDGPVIIEQKINRRWKVAQP